MAWILTLLAYKTGPACFLLSVPRLSGFVSASLCATNFLTLVDSFQKTSEELKFSPTDKHFSHVGAAAAAEVNAAVAREGAGSIAR